MCSTSFKFTRFYTPGCMLMLLLDCLSVWPPLFNVLPYIQKCFSLMFWIILWPSVFLSFNHSLLHRGLHIFSLLMFIHILALNYHIDILTARNPITFPPTSFRFLCLIRFQSGINCCKRLVFYRLERQRCEKGSYPTCYTTHSFRDLFFFLFLKKLKVKPCSHLWLVCVM